MRRDYFASQILRVTLIQSEVQARQPLIGCLSASTDIYNQVTV
jgi:hypothetical protein